MARRTSTTILTGEDPDYLTQQLITYIGNKRALLEFIGLGLTRVMKKINRKKITSFDVFSGSGVVARYLKQHSSSLIVNDLEKYSEIINRCYLSNQSELNLSELKDSYKQLIYDLRNRPFRKGFLQDLYAPETDRAIQEGERVFYTSRNARYLDTARQYIQHFPEDQQVYFLAPLLSEASIHANTSGVFKGFYKNSDTGIGQFGGRKGDALFRILGDIKIPFPVFSNFECEYQVYRENSNTLIERLPEVDVAYLDPPYNQHPYGSNYFMLNLIVDYQRPTETSDVSGIPVGWNRSLYNKRAYAHEALSALVAKLNAKFLMVSFNSEGFIKRSEMESMLKRHGKLSTLETRYNTFRGSRNLNARDLHVSEYLYLLEKR